LPFIVVPTPDVVPAPAELPIVEEPAAGPHSVTLHIVGDCAAQGSKTAFVNPRTGRPVMREMGGVRLKTWRTAVAEAAAEYAELPPLDGPLWLNVTFRFAMPASRRRAARLAGIAFKSTAPDLDKLVRSTGDALKTAGLIRDDARFARIHADKVEILDGWLGATIAIHRLEL
jgi:Holliday junction resolvase RusA-like endonuclease